MINYPTFSIIINTLNRGTELHKTLTSLQWLKYPGDFEVIVVNGPSTDNSEEVIDSWKGSIRTGTCDVANISVSRNIGICMAQGDIVAFIDDDALPEPEWLTQLAEAYTDRMVGAAGGLVYDHTGYTFLYKYCLVDRFGNADLSSSSPMPSLSYPQSIKFPHILGCNASFRRLVLLEVGGFDEEFEYFLDETDVCLRIMDAGYIIAQLSKAYVHHKYAPSNIRGSNRVTRSRYSIVKNLIYFALKHAQEFYSFEYVMKEVLNIITRQRKEVLWCIEEHLLTAEDGIAFEHDAQRGLEVGIKHGMRVDYADTLIKEEKIKNFSGSFHPFHVLKTDNDRVIVMISQDFPPDHGGGIGIFNKDLAEALAAEGNIVHIITKSRDINRVDFEKGVWVHRMLVEEVESPSELLERGVPQHIWNWSATALKETTRISTHRKIDVVEVPIWDCEGIAFLFPRQWPLLVSLQTTLHFWLESHPKQKNNDEWMKRFGIPMLALEKEIMQQADGIRSISHAIMLDIERVYDFKFDKDKVAVIALGVPAAEPRKVTSRPIQQLLTILYVGRLEYRKGIDVLLNAILILMDSGVEFCVRIIGDDTLPLDDGKTYKDAFLDEYSEKDWLSKIQFEGRVDNETLIDAYASCDIFVAPSRFESFGLIFLEAMREGKPVIGCRAGGMPEIISHGVNGLLVEPGDVDELVEALLRLIEDNDLCCKMGTAGREIFEKKFTAKQMAQKSRALYELAEKHFAGVEA